MMLIPRLIILLVCTLIINVFIQRHLLVKPSRIPICSIILPDVSTLELQNKIFYSVKNFPSTSFYLWVSASLYQGPFGLNIRLSNATKNKCTSEESAFLVFLLFRVNYLIFSTLRHFSRLVYVHKFAHKHLLITSMYCHPGFLHYPFSFLSYRPSFSNLRPI